MIIKNLSPEKYAELKNFLPTDANLPFRVGRFESFRTNGHLDGQEILSSEPQKDGSAVRVWVNDELIGNRPGTPAAQFLQSLHA